MLKCLFRGNQDNGSKACMIYHINYKAIAGPRYNSYLSGANVLCTLHQNSTTEKFGMEILLALLTESNTINKFAVGSIRITHFKK